VSTLYRIFGTLGSPYSLKMRAVLRYRRLPHIFINAGPGHPEIAHVTPQVIPVIQFPDGGFHVDSTPMIDELEARHPGERSIVPGDPGLAFLAYLLEDFADEWVTKMMFHYRWFREMDQRFFSRWGSFDLLGPTGRGKIEEAATGFAGRQVGRMALVGCTEQNRPIIEGTFRELLEVLESHVTEMRFLFGSRPSRADFGLFGQLSQLASDPTPLALMRDAAFYTYRWIVQLDDAGGLEGDWIDPTGPLPDAVLKLLRLTGKVYLPFLHANAEAFEKNQPSFRLDIRGQTYEQAPFKYQVKCLAELRRHFAALEGEPRSRVHSVLRDTGCLHTGIWEGQ
jgi:glutathione S-transferase